MKNGSVQTQKVKILLLCPLDCTKLMQTTQNLGNKYIEEVGQIKVKTIDHDQFMLWYKD